MKKAILILALIISSNLMASITKPQANQLLKAKGTSLEVFENRGARIILGEVTGGGRLVPLSKVEVIFTKDEAILKSEIEAASPSLSQTLGNLESLRYNGRYITSSDVVGVIAR